MDKFGFECDTCCGFIPMPNEWQNNWVVSSKLVYYIVHVAITSGPCLCPWMVVLGLSELDADSSFIPCLPMPPLLIAQHKHKNWR